MVSEAKRASIDRWEKEHLTRFTVKVKKEVAEEFKITCKENGKTPNDIFREAIKDYISVNKKAGE